jgi:type II secretory ATPase GspE/PulE/Tfp pilus assembly ATPase PilB-like protein
MQTLRRSALSKVVEGTTTLSEVFRVSAADN